MAEVAAGDEMHPERIQGLLVNLEVVEVVGALRVRAGYERKAAAASGERYRVQWRRRDDPGQAPQVSEIFADRGYGLVVVGEAGARDHEDVGHVDPGRTADLLDTLHDDVEGVHQHRERYGDLHGHQHRAGAVAQQRREDRADIEAHGVNSFTGFSDTRPAAAGRRATP